MRKRSKLEDDFWRHLEQHGKTVKTQAQYMRVVRRFLRHVGDKRPDRISESCVKEFFHGWAGREIMRRSSTSS